MFYISLLESALLGVLPTSIIKIQSINLNVKYTVETILDHKIIKKTN